MTNAPPGRRGAGLLRWHDRPKSWHQGSSLIGANVNTLIAALASFARQRGFTSAYRGSSPLADTALVFGAASLKASLSALLSVGRSQAGERRRATRNANGPGRRMSLNV